MPNIVVGCVVAIVSSALQSTGLTLQRKAHIIESSQDTNVAQSNAQILWRVGVLLFVVSNLVGSGIQLISLPLLVLCPLQAVGLVFNSLFASILLGESLSTNSLLGTGLVVVGAGVVAGFGALPEPDLSLDKLIKQLSRSSFVLWFLLSLGLAAVLASIAVRRKSHESKGMCYGVLCGILSAHSLLMAKSAVLLLISATHKGFKDILRIQFLLIVALFALFAILQLYFVNKGLKYASTSILYPLVFCVFNLISMINALLYYELFDTLKGYKVMAVVMGTGMLLAGVFCLSGRLDTGPFQPEERVPLIQSIRTSEYTSLHNIHPGVVNPDAPASRITRMRPYRSHKRRALSREESQILHELGS